MFLKNVNEIINFFLVAFFESVTRSQMKFFFFLTLKEKAAMELTNDFFCLLRLRMTMFICFLFCFLNFCRTFSVGLTNDELRKPIRF